MTRTVMARNLVAATAIAIVSVGLSGCDYWPPALQTQIEQLRSELQSVTLEKTQLQNQFASFAKVKDDFCLRSCATAASAPSSCHVPHRSRRGYFTA